MISVIIPAYNDGVGVMTALNSLQVTATAPQQYLVQDDASPQLICSAVVPPAVASVERNERNLGFPGNCNAGARRAKGDILLFLNQDVYAVPDLSTGWDQALIEAFSDPDIGIVGPRLLFPDGRIQSAGGLYDAKCQPYHRCIGYTDHDHHEVSTPRDVSWTTGAALAIRRWLFEDIGGFATDYVDGYFEDVDLCCRVRYERHMRVRYEPRATLIHSVGSTGGNPYFSDNARLWYQRWVDSKQVTPDTSGVYERFW